MRVPEQLQVVVEQRRGLVTVAELREAGVSRVALRWQLGRGWRLPLPGVVAVFTGALDPSQRLVAAQLWADPRSQLASVTAAWWHGFDVSPCWQ